MGPEAEPRSRVVVTGASGFVGRGLTRELGVSPYPVIGLARRGEHGFVQVGDIGSQTDWSEVLEGADAIIHLAARVHIMRDPTSDPISAFREVNLEGTRRLSASAVVAGVRRLIFLSSVKVNGEQTAPGVPFSFSDPADPNDAYAVSKWEAERALHEIAADTGLEVVIVRPPLVYGPGVRANFLRLIRLVQRGMPLPLASVDNLRSLLCLDNLVDLLIRCIDHPRAAGQTFLVSDGHDLSTPDLIRGLARAMGRPARLFPCPPSLLRMVGRATGRLAEIDRLIGSLQVDIRHTCETLDWTPPVSVEEGLRRAVEPLLKGST